MTFLLFSSATGDEAATRSFNEYSTRDELARTLINYYEDFLQQSQICQHGESNQEFEYSSEDLFSFVDDFFGELVCLVKQDATEDLWIPYGPAWVKEAIYLHLRSQCKEELNNDQLMEYE